MEAKDTVMTDEKIAGVLHYTPITTKKFESKLTAKDKEAFRDEMGIELRAVAKAQDEISFKAGRESLDIPEIIDKAHKEGYEQSVLDNDNWAKADYGYELAIREVVEWGGERCQEHKPHGMFGGLLGMLPKRACGACWQAFKKDKGV